VWSYDSYPCHFFGSYDLFLTWRERWASDGVSNIHKDKYKLVKNESRPLYTNLLVDIGVPPANPPFNAQSQRESWIW
jgi:hypothetical protein